MKASVTQGSAAVKEEERTVISKGPGRLWGMILAGGDGRRPEQLMRWLTGRDLPKQYCAVIGRRSMFQHTVH